jgi:hypothetical protein
LRLVSLVLAAFGVSASLERLKREDGSGAGWVVVVRRRPEVVGEDGSAVEVMGAGSSICRRGLGGTFDSDIVF